MAHKSAYKHCINNPPTVGKRKNTVNMIAEATTICDIFRTISKGDIFTRRYSRYRFMAINVSRANERHRLNASNP